MVLKKEARFVLSGRDNYKIGDKVPVYTNNVSSDEILGYATVKELKDTNVRNLDNTVEPHTDTTFEFDDELITKYPGYAPMFNGLSKRLSIFNEEAYYESQKKQKNRWLNDRKEEAKKMIFNHIVICENCDFSIGSSHEIDDIECPNCRENGILMEL